MTPNEILPGAPMVGALTVNDGSAISSPVRRLFPATETKAPPIPKSSATCPRNSATETGAAKLAETIVRAWRALGYDDVEAWVEYLPGSQGSVPVFAIRSNLIGGLPPSARSGSRP